MILQLSKIKDGRSFIQINYYYDTSSFEFHNKNETVRVRLNDEGLKFEHKLHKGYNNETRICEEKIESIDMLPKSINIQQYELFFIGCMTTQRTNFMIDGYLISLDKNYYLDTIDYEIEIESNSVEFSSFMLAILDSGRLMPGKYSKFISALKKINQCDSITL